MDLHIGVAGTLEATHCTSSRLMLLQVDFETLKVENQELRSRLLQALRRLDSKTPSTGRHSKEEVKKEVTWRLVVAVPSSEFCYRSRHPRSKRR